MQAQTLAVEIQSLETISMVDPQIGWAIARTERISQDHARDSACGTRPGRVYSCLLLRSTDAGTHWKDVTPISASGREPSRFRISVFSPDIAWVIPEGIGEPIAEILRTVDGGRTWKSTSTPAGAVGSISFITPREGWINVVTGFYPPHNTLTDIYRTNDGGDKWIKIKGCNCTEIVFLNSTTGWMSMIEWAHDSLGLFVTRDGGRTWRLQKIPLPVEVGPHWQVLSQPPPKFFTARDGILPVFYDLLGDSLQETGRQFVLYATHDSGETWTHTKPLPFSLWGSFITYAAVDTNHAWVKQENVLYVTNDGGRRWTTMPPNPLLEDVSQLGLVSPEVGWAVRNAKQRLDPPTFPFLLKTLDGGRTWS